MAVPNEFTFYKADCTQNKENCIYPHRVVVTNADEFNEMAKHDHVCAEYRGNYRGNSNFIWANTLPADSDNEGVADSSEWITAEDIHQMFAGVPHIISKSKNNMKQKGNKPAVPRNHVFFAIEPETDRESYAALKHYAEPYQVASIEQIGKLGLAAALQMPGSARSNSQRMYLDEYYYGIFGSDARAGVMADVLRISTYYDKFLKYQLKDKGYDEKTVLPMFKNGRTFQFAAISFLCKINYNVFSYDTIASVLNNVDELKTILRQMGDMEKLISGQIEDEEGLFFEVFSIIGDEVLGYCYENALYKAEEEQRTIAPSDYLKLDGNYYKDIIKRLWNRYKQNSDLKARIDMLCDK